ncbi:TetR/AcrR family transcriptional regulator [Achromobacter agilis]|uniref:HTH-type transcriptional repressor ComR n=1 Tax=Achromobacter agilis TaxID=1353888 RepID=A0A446CIA3_9BURK|nr:TetR/AcrR family transcriptional regulator [Achromobacter agilis]SSW67493.1 HTH-type transcriptional repressor ComR [Achromobacter agilis]
MARPKEFDEAAALDAAIQCFWSRGYEATSVRDLADAMGIAGPSLYNTFGDKRKLYRQALEHYVERGFCNRVRRFESELAPRAAIEAFFDEIIELSLADDQRKGCMIVNSALELAPHDAEFQAALANVLRDMEAFFHRCVEAGQGSGAISAALPADDLARMLLGLLMGLRVLARSRPEPELLRGVVRPALALLDGAGPSQQGNLK